MCAAMAMQGLPTEQSEELQQMLSCMRERVARLNLDEVSSPEVVTRARTAESETVEVVTRARNAGGRGQVGNHPASRGRGRGKGRKAGDSAGDPDADKGGCASVSGGCASVSGGGAPGSTQEQGAERNAGEKEPEEEPQEQEPEQEPHVRLQAHRQRCLDMTRWPEGRFQKSGPHMFRFNRSPQLAQCSHDPLRQSTQNQWGFNVWCPNCQLRMHIRWNRESRAFQDQTSRVNIAMGILMELVR